MPVNYYLITVSFNIAFFCILLVNCIYLDLCPFGICPYISSLVVFGARKRQKKEKKGKKELCVLKYQKRKSNFSTELSSVGRALDCSGCIAAI